MMKKIIPGFAALAFLLTVLVACQAQTEASEVDPDTLFEQILNDPLAIEHRMYVKETQMMIATQSVDLVAIHKYFEASGETSYCDLHDDLSMIKGGREYADIRCKRETLYSQIQAKYPQMDKLSQQQKIAAIQHADMGPEDIQDIINSRMTPPGVKKDE